jgi:hypothetical protein
MVSFTSILHNLKKIHPKLLKVISAIKIFEMIGVWIYYNFVFIIILVIYF